MQCDDCRYSIKSDIDNRDKRCLIRYGITCGDVRFGIECSHYKDTNESSDIINKSDVSYEEIEDIVDYLDIDRDEVHTDSDATSFIIAIVDLKRTINEILRETDKRKEQ